MYKRAICFDETTVFYFDEFDRKYVAEGGSLAWRLNNPGLLRSHIVDNFIHRSIGSCDRLAIFSDRRVGKAVLVEWLRSSKHSITSLHEIAEHYQPENLSECLNRVCGLTGLSAKVKLNEISANQLDRLVEAIQELSGFRRGEKEFRMLPKIAARGQFLNKPLLSYWRSNSE